MRQSSALSDITVTLDHGRTVPATLAGRDSFTDIAVLKLPDVELPVAQIGEASSLKVGTSASDS